MRNAILLLNTVVLSIAITSTRAEPPATQATTQPATFTLVREEDASVGMSFERPAEWKTAGARIINPKSAEAEIRFEMDGFDANVQSTVTFSGESAGGFAKIDVTTPASPSASASKIFTVDGQPARLTAYQSGQAELLLVQTSKGTHFYNISMVFPSSERDRYLALADTICASVRITTP